MSMESQIPPPTDNIDKLYARTKIRNEKINTWFERGRQHS
jgi:hypothetical protein